jgi:hypothetical protein
MNIEKVYSKRECLQKKLLMLEYEEGGKKSIKIV